MCKPTVTHLPIISNGPCSFSVRSFQTSCGAFSLALKWREGLANVLRTAADKIEKQKSFTIVAYGPPCIQWNDVMEGVTHGMNGANLYLNDLWRDRTSSRDDLGIETISMSKPIE